MGDFKSLMSMILGMSKMIKNFDIDNNVFNKVEVIIFSMMFQECVNFELMNMSCKCCIVDGCGQLIEEINMFLKQFD